MKSYRKELWFNTESRREYINITREVDTCLSESGVKEGLCLVNAMHITASVYINDAESGLIQDYDDWLEELAPHAPLSQYLHNHTGEACPSAHLQLDFCGLIVYNVTTSWGRDPHVTANSGDS